MDYPTDNKIQNHGGKTIVLVICSIYHSQKQIGKWRHIHQWAMDPFAFDENHQRMHSLKGDHQDQAIFIRDWIFLI